MQRSRFAAAGAILPSMQRQSTCSAHRVNNDLVESVDFSIHFCGDGRVHRCGVRYGGYHCSQGSVQVEGSARDLSLCWRSFRSC